MRNRVRGFRALLLICLLWLPGLAGVPVAGRAQSGIQVTLTPPNTDQFPRIEASIDVRDAEGKFLRGLKADQVRVVENGASLPVDSLRELRPGAQFVVVLNPGPSFGVRDSRGVSRYETIVEALSHWAGSRQGSDLDDLSLLTTNSLEISHVSDPAEWREVLSRELVDAKEAVPNLDSLYQAIDFAADPTPRPGMGRVVLFITPPLEDPLSASLANIPPLANQQGVRIAVWMVASEGSYPARAADELQALAAQTGGSFFNYTGEEGLPSPEEYLNPLRSIYQIAYQSQVQGSGAYELAVDIQTEAEQISSAPVELKIDLRPPDPAFVSPALEIQRQPIETNLSAALKAKNEDALLTPSEHELKVVVSFPDGRQRDLRRTTLYVDGAPVAENTQPPFDEFTWDLSEYTDSGTHLLKVEAEDSFGLVGTGMETAVQITIDQPAATPVSSLYQKMPVLAGLAILLVGAVLVLALVLGGRLHPYPRDALRRRKSSPVSQPAPVKSDAQAPRRLPGWVNRLQWPQRHNAPKAYAFLSQLSETDHGLPGAPIPITTEEITLGSDPNLAILVLNDPSVDGLHARLVRQEGGGFRLADEGSIAGTWINYSPVSREGSTLEHGDLVHIGRVGFSFTLRQPGQVRRPVVTLSAPAPDERGSGERGSGERGSGERGSGEPDVETPIEEARL